MIHMEKNLKTSVLFKGLDDSTITDTLKKINYRISSYSKNQTIAIEGEDCNSIGIVLNGVIEVQKLYPSGKLVTISRIKRGDIFGEVIIFSNMKVYPSTIVSTDNTEILFISKSDVLRLCTLNMQILNNFMELLSNKILVLNRKLKNLSYQTIREKISSFILDEYKKQKNLTVKVKLSRRELAELFGIPRPSLSRELVKMKKDGLIDFDRYTITIKDLEKLERVLE